MILALRYLVYILGLPDSHLVHCAFTECVSLYQRGIPNWLGDLALVIRHIPYQTPIFDPLNMNVEAAKILIKKVTIAMKLHIDATVQGSSKGALLEGRLQYIKDEGLRHEAMYFCQYMWVLIPDHQKALAQMFLADHSLAEAKLCYSERHRAAIPRHWRLCRLCQMF